MENALRHRQSTAKETMKQWLWVYLTTQKDNKVAAKNTPSSRRRQSLFKYRYMLIKMELT